MALSATQRAMIMDLLDMGGGPENFKEYLFQSRKALSGNGMMPEERAILIPYLKSMDTAMKKLALYHIGATEAQNEEESQETLNDLTGMWHDICLLLRSPTLQTLSGLESFSNSKAILAKVNRLDYLKSHLCHKPSSDEETINRAKRAKVDSSGTVNVPVSNQFSVLANDSSSSTQPTPAEIAEAKSMEQVDTEEQPTVQEPPKRPRVEPIFIALIPNYSQLIQHLNSSILQHKVIGKVVGEHIKIIPGSPDDYRALTAYLLDNKINFHAILPKAEKPMKVLIKGLGSETPSEDIAAELKELGFTPINISALRNRTSRGKLPLFHVTLMQTPQWERIYDVDILQSVYVKIQRFYSTAPKQCYRCQGYGHSSQTCYMPDRCLKCAMNHPTKECKKPPNTPATCVNCKGAHTANYRGCPANPRNKKPQLPFKERYFQQLRAEKDRKRIASMQRMDAPAPQFPAWLSRNDKIYNPPVKKAPPSTSKQPVPSHVTPQPPSTSAAAVAPSTLSKAEKRANAAKISYQNQQRIAAQHQDIISVPEIQTLPSAGVTSSSLSDIIGTFREFQNIMETLRLKDIILLLKQTAINIKAAPTEMDKLAVLLEAANSLSQIFPSI